MINFYADIETKTNQHSTMIGFSLEFKRWYITLRGPRGRVYLCTGFAKHIPVFISPAQAYKFDQAADWGDDETDEELLNTLKSIR